MHSSEEQSWHFDTTTSIVAPVQLARLQRFASKTSRTITAWWLVSNLKQMPLTMKCQIKNQNNTSSLTRQRAGMLWKLAPFYMFYCFLFGVTFCIFGPLLDQGSWQLFQSCHACQPFLVKRFGPETAWKHQSLAFCYLNLQTVAPVELARIGWLPRQAKPSLHGG